MENEIQKLMAGYARFRNLQSQAPYCAYKEVLQQNQQPIALVITCCDARIDPVTILDCDPGELFLIRNVANLIPPYEEDSHYHGTSAALEFGICYLHIPHIIILGHSECGGIQSLFEQHTNPPNSFIHKWMELAQVSCQTNASHSSPEHRREQENLCGKQALVGSRKNLMTFPWIQKRVEAGNLQLHAWYFKLPQGVIEAFNPQTLNFELLCDETTRPTI